MLWNRLVIVILTSFILYEINAIQNDLLTISISISFFSDALVENAILHKVYVMDVISRHLDMSCRGIQNWRHLASLNGVPESVQLKYQAGEQQSRSEKMFDLLSTTHPGLLIGTLKQHLSGLNINSVELYIQGLKLRGKELHLLKACISCMSSYLGICFGFGALYSGFKSLSYLSSVLNRPDKCSTTNAIPSLATLVMTIYSVATISKSLKLVLIPQASQTHDSRNRSYIIINDLLIYVRISSET